MSLAIQPVDETTSDRMTVEEYLAAEELADCRHEYVGGYVYAMAGGLPNHSLMGTNVAGLLHAQLRGHPCRVFNSDMKLLVNFRSIYRFYYPDSQVVCRLAPQDQAYQTEPVVIVEVASQSTRRTDEVEKLEAYTSLPSLQTYVLFEQMIPAVKVWRRKAEGFELEILRGLDATVPLPEIACKLALLEIYEGVDLSPKTQT